MNQNHQQWQKNSERNKQDFLKIQNMMKDNNNNKDQKNTNQQKINSTLAKIEEFYGKLAQIDAKTSQILKENKNNSTNLAYLNNLSKKLKQQQEKDSNDTKEVVQQVKDEISEVKEGLSDTNRHHKKLSERLWTLNDIVYKSQADKLQNLETESEIEIIKKDITGLKDKVKIVMNKKDKDKSDLSLGSGGHLLNFKDGSLQNQTKLTDMYGTTQVISDKNNNNNNNNNFNNLNNNNKIPEIHENQDWKIQFQQRICQIRHEFLRCIKKIQLKDNYDDGQKDKRIDRLEQKILQIFHLIGGKIDSESIKKMFNYLEDKINILTKILMSNNNNQQDAAIAKKGWLCLSCDKKLDNYRGKIGSHLVHNNLKIKLKDPETTVGGMMLKSKSKIDLPSVDKKKF